LLPLTRDGKRIEVVEQMISELVAHDNPDLLGFAYLFSALTFTNQDNQAWLKRRFAMFEDILEDSWAYQELIERGLQKGLQEGLQKGRKKGLQEGRKKGLQEGQKKGLQEGLRQAALTIVEAHFPALVPQANAWVERIHDPATLQHLILLLSLAKSAEEAEHILNSDTSASS
jgi:predicted transposase YdaD